MTHGARSGAALVALLLFGAACDVPTDVPGWDTTWRIPGEETEIGVAELLPGAMTLSEDGAAFELALDPTTTTARLADLCALCPQVGSAVAPKPAFTATIPTEVPLPQGVNAATLSGGGIAFELANGFSFDPVRPSSDASAPRGSMELVLRSGGAVIARSVIDGDEAAFPPGTTLTRTLVADGELEVEGPIDAEVFIDSPMGDVTTMRADDEFGVTISSDGLEVSSARVVADEIEVRGTEARLNFADVDETIADNAKRGLVQVIVENPFALEGTLQVEIDPLDAPPVQETFTLEPGAVSTSTLTISGEDLQAVLGSDNALTVGGTVSAVSGELVLEPMRAILIDTELVLTVGPTEEE